MCDVACNRHTWHVTCCAWVRCEVAPHIAPGDPSTSHHSTDAVLTVKTLNIFIYTTYPQSLIISRIYRLGENRRFITPTLHDFSWRYFSYIYNRDISGHPVLCDHYVSTYATSSTLFRHDTRWHPPSPALLSALCHWKVTHHQMRIRIPMVRVRGG